MGGVRASAPERGTAMSLPMIDPVEARELAAWGPYPIREGEP